jgi:hypothetical protein
MQTIGWQETASGTAKRVTLATLALRNVIVGGNLAAARLIAEPAQRLIEAGRAGRVRGAP